MKERKEGRKKRRKEGRMEDWKKGRKKGRKKENDFYLALLLYFWVDLNIHTPS